MDKVKPTACFVTQRKTISLFWETANKRQANIQRKMGELKSMFLRENFQEKLDYKQYQKCNSVIVSLGCFVFVYTYTDRGKMTDLHPET